jgi:predicted dehydrogenase/sugar phosphate isomerase/epimerase
MVATIPAVMVGCGRRAQTHAKAMTRSDAFDLVAVCDLERSRAEETAQRFGVSSVYADLDEAIAEERPTHVSAITPPGIRPGVVEAVLEHEPESLVTEKPIANDLAGVERIEAAAETVATRVTICHQKVFAEEIRAVKRWIDAGHLGELERFVGSTKLGLADQGSHFMHTIEWLLGERAASVRGFAEGPEHLRGQDNLGHAEPADASIEVAYPGGAHAFLHHGERAPDVPGRPDYLQYRLDVVGSEGYAQFALGQHASARFADGTVRRVDEVPEFDEDAYMTTALYDAQAEVLRGEREAHPSRLAAAAAVHRTIDGALRSAIEGRTVAPAERSPPLGVTTNERLERRLAGRQPVCVPSDLFPDRDLESALDAIRNLGGAAVDLAAGPDGPDHLGEADPETVGSALSSRGLTAPVVSTGSADLTSGLIERSAAIGAEALVVDARSPDAGSSGLAEALDVAADRDLTVAFANRIGRSETAADLVAVLDELDHSAAGACLSPMHLAVAGESVAAAVPKLGDELAVIRIQDAEPDASLSGQRSRPDSQVPGGGGAIPIESLLEAAVERAPLATWTFALEGTDEWDERRVLAAIERSIRYVEPRRPV